MAQDTAASHGAKQEPVDIDDLEVSILILAKNPTQLKTTVAFLSRRGWPTHCVGNLSAAIEYVAEKKPDFILISFNHPSPTIIKLPELIAQTFNLTCVGFVEGADAGSTQKLNQFKIRHKIFGQPSGPNFQRGLRRILAEKFNVKIDDRTQDEAGEREKSSITIRGGQPSDNQSRSVTQKSEPGSGGPRDSQTATGLDGAGDYIASGESDSVNGRDTTGASRVAAGSRLDIVEASAQERQSGMSGKLEGAGYGSVIQANEAAGGTSGEQPNSEGAEAKSPGLVSNGKYTMGRKRRSLKDIMAATGSEGAVGTGAMGDINGLPVPLVTGAGQAAVVAPDLLGMLKKSLFGEDGEEPKAERSPQSALELAVEASFNQVCDKNPDIEPIPVLCVRGLGVFPLDSGTCPGYLIVAFETDHRNEQKLLLKTIETVLQKNFEGLSVPAKVENSFWIEFPEVPFDAWVDAAADFTFKIDHVGAELGVAFFSTKKPLPRARVAPENGMHTIELDEISTDQPVNFKAYLHLKKNKKYFLYLRNGRRLQPEQKVRLKGRKVNDIFMKSVDVENLRVFLAAVYLHSTIKRNDDAA